MMLSETTNVINQSILDSAMSYDEYMELLEDLFEQGKTTGDNHSEAMLNYAKMNLHRMNRLNKTIVLNDDLNNTLNSNPLENITLLVITEGWCGDAAQNLPLINHIAKSPDSIQLKLILRDENLEVMDQFLTNGGRSIPKLIALKTVSLEVIGTWGPRPETAQKMVADFKKVPNGDYKEFTKQVQLWYARDKTNSLQLEMNSLLKEWGFKKQ